MFCSISRQCVGEIFICRVLECFVGLICFRLFAYQSPIAGWCWAFCVFIKFAFEWFYAIAVYFTKEYKEFCIGRRKMILCELTSRLDLCTSSNMRLELRSEHWTDLLLTNQVCITQSPTHWHDEVWYTDLKNRQAEKHLRIKILPTTRRQQIFNSPLFISPQIGSRILHPLLHQLLPLQSFME